MRKLRLISIVTLVMAIMVLAAGGRPAAAAPQEQPGPRTWTVLVGLEIFTEPGERSTWQAMKFYPERITINEGDTVQWRFNAGPEPHTVTFLGPMTEKPQDFLPPDMSGPAGPPRIELNPQAGLPQGGNTYDGSAYTSSGIVSADTPGPKVYSLTFPKAGSYEYLCLLHAFPGPGGMLMGMVGNVTVQAAGSAAPMTQAQIDAAAMAEMEADKQRAMTEEPQVKQHAMPAAPGPNGSMIHHVMSGYMTQDMELEYLRFVPENLTINQGDTVRWTSHGFHTVTFGEEPELLLVEPQAAGPPRMFLNPAVLPAGDQVYRGTGYYNSGPITSEMTPPDPISVKSYSLTFAAPGRFEYICIPHYHNGMDGTITVQAMGAGGTTPGGTTPGMPRTGAGSDWTMIAWALLAALALPVAGLALRRRWTA